MQLRANRDFGTPTESSPLKMKWVDKCLMSRLVPVLVCELVWVLAGGLARESARELLLVLFQLVLDLVEIFELVRLVPVFLDFVSVPWLLVR